MKKIKIIDIILIKYEGDKIMSKCHKLNVVLKIIILTFIMISVLFVNKANANQIASIIIDVFIEDDGTNLYHKYDCYKFLGNNCWAHNTEYAKYLGYKPCPLCCD